MKRLLPYLSYLQPYRLQFGFAIFFGIIAGLANGAGLPYMIKTILPVVFDGSSVDASLLFATASLIPLTMSIRGVSGFYNTLLMKYCGVRVLEDIRCQLFNRLQELPLRFFQKRDSGDIMSRVITDTERLQEAVTTSCNELIRQPFTLIGALGFFTYTAWQQEEILYVVFGLSVIPLCVLPIRLLGKKVLKRAAQRQNLLSELTHHLSENLQATREIRAFNLQEKEKTRFQKIIQSFLHAQLKVVKYSSMLSPIIEIIASAGIAFTIYYAGIKGVGAEDIIAIVTALYLCYEPVKKLGALHNLSREGLASLDRIEEVLHIENEVPETSQPVALPQAQGHIRFENASFAYDKQITLQPFTLDVPAGQCIALVGPSGAGKSTFANLIPRFYELSAGQLTLDSIPIKNLSKENLRQHIAIVSQEPILFHESIADNIRRGRLDATPEEITTAAQKAEIHDFINELPEQYDTMVGERGTRLSGGQKQRIALARAFLKKAPILILDEATSALDSESEQKIQNALQQLIREKTVFIVAHRFSTIQFCQRILVFDQGAIVGDGSHKELIDSNTLYQKLYRNQKSE